MVQQSQMPAGANDPVWKDNPEMARDYLSRSDTGDEMRQEVFKIMTSLTPHDKDATLEVLDIGSGQGVLATAFLEAFPNSKATGLDVSEDMMAEGKKRMARFGDRFHFHVGDFSVGKLPDDIGQFDIVVSSLAIHHANPDNKKKLFASIYTHLKPGGVFIDLDNMRLRDDFLQRNYDRVRNLLGDPRGPRAVRAPRDPNLPPPEPRPEGQREWTDPLDWHLEGLREAGFPHVDVMWRRLDYGMVGGFKE